MTRSPDRAATDMVERAALAALVAVAMLIALPAISLDWIRAATTIRCVMARASLCSYRNAGRRPLPDQTERRRAPRPDQG